MKYLTFILIIFPVISSVIFPQDTTWVDLPSAYTHINYQNSDYGISLGDESSLDVISAPTWINVDFITDPTNWITYVNISGIPEPVHFGNNELVVGWFEWNYETGEEELWDVFVFTILVEYPCCNDPSSCNYDPGWCEDEHCLYEVMCFVNPCQNATCEYYPDAECVPDYCGGCFPDFYMNGLMVDCAVPPEYDVFLSWEYPDTVTAGSTGNIMTLSLENSMDVGGIQFQLFIDPAESVTITQIEPTERSENMMINWNYSDSFENYNIFISDILNYISPGEGPILKLYFDVDLPDGDFQVQFENMIISEYPVGYTLSVSLPEPPVITIRPCIPGDVNFDDEINILDIVAMVNCIIENVEGQCPCMDVNHDGDVNILDVVLMVNIIIEGSLPDDCNLEPDIGPCDGLCPRYFYNTQTQQCEMFMWGCCNGVVPFETLEECEETCY